MNKERFHKAIDKVFDKLSKMIKEEFYNELEKHKDGDFTKIIKETGVLGVGRK